MTWIEGGTHLPMFLLGKIGHGSPQPRHYFIMDNLNTHHDKIIAQVIHAAGHRIAFRAPYYPVDRPIEYFSNTLQQALTLDMRRIFTNEDMLKCLYRIIAVKLTFELYLIQCHCHNHN